MLYGNYYIIIAFDKDPYDNASNLELNKAIAAFIVDKLSITSMSLTCPLRHGKSRVKINQCVK